MVAQTLEKEKAKQELEKQSGYDSDSLIPLVNDEEEDQKYLNDNIAYQEWKMRELLRLKRARDEAKERKE